MKLAKAFQEKCLHTFRLKYEQLHGNFPLLLTQRQRYSLQKAKQNKSGLKIKFQENK